MCVHKIFVDLEGRAHAHAVAAALQELVTPVPDALTLFEVKSETQKPDFWRIEAYFEIVQDPVALKSAVEALLECKLPEFKAADVPDLNWVAISQQSLPPVFAGRFTVHGSHDRFRIPRGPRSIVIEAGEAFGTAHHATTYGCLSAIDRLTRHRQFHNVLDLGCGSGVLAIALGRVLPRARIFASDLDARSVAVARENVRTNGASARIRPIQALGLEHPEFRKGPAFDLIVSNILAEPLIRLAGRISRKLKSNGSLILSGILVPQTPQVVAAYRAHGLVVIRHDRMAGWSALEFRKRGIAPKRCRA